MNKNSFAAFAAILLGFLVMDYVIHQIILKSAYEVLMQEKVFRAAGDSKTYVFLVIRVLECLVLAYVFPKGYESKGIVEGVRFGLYFGLVAAAAFSYSSYALFPIPYKLSMQWFIYETLEFVGAGVILSNVFKNQAKPPRM